MASSLVDSLLGLVTPGLLSSASTSLGEPEGSISKGLGAALPALLAGLADRSGDTSTMQRLLSLASDPSLDTDVLSNPARALGALSGGSGSGLGALASALLPLALGDRSSSLGSALARYAGLRNPSSGPSLLALAAPLVLGLLRDRSQRDGLGAAGLGRWLGTQRDALRGAVPSGLERVTTTGSAVRPVAPERRRPAWVLPLLLLLGLGLLWSLLRGGSDEPEVATRPVPAPVAAAPPAERVVVESARLTLPGGAALDVPAGSLEAQLVRFIDSGSAVNDTSWFNFERLLFETGSAQLKPESRQQLQNVARILQAYPAIQAKIGGYTDNTGDPAANLSLSQARAESVRSELAALGVAPNRLTAEGYGEQHPVATNATDEGRAQNRRIALLVTEK